MLATLNLFYCWYVFPLLCFRCAASLSQSINQVAASRQKHTLPDLTYDYGALEPHINAEIMQLHHSKHHATYVNNLNVTEEKYQEALAKGTNFHEPISELLLYLEN